MRTLLFLFAFACSSSGNASSGVPATNGVTCSSLAQAICEKACPCTGSAPNARCSMSAANSNGGTTNSTMSPCQGNLTARTCGFDAGARQSMYDTCYAALGSAQCGSDGADAMLMLPAACKGVLDKP